MFAATRAIRAPATRAVKRPERCGGSGWENVGVGLTETSLLASLSIDGPKPRFGYVKPAYATGREPPRSRPGHARRAAGRPESATAPAPHAPGKPCAA